MFCPQCGAEFREGFDTCSDCKVPLVNQLSSVPAGDPQDDLSEPDDLAVVLETDNALFAEAARSWLESANIHGFLSGGPSGRVACVPGTDNYHGFDGIIRIEVAKRDEQNANDLLSELQKEQPS